MRKIIYSFLVMTTAFCLADNVNLQDLPPLERMPSDAEIMKVINKYDFDSEQKAYLFKETKRKLQLLMQQQNQNVGVKSNSKRSSSVIYDNAEVQSDKKYTKHAPLTRRSKGYGLQ